MRKKIPPDSFDDYRWAAMQDRSGPMVTFWNKMEHHHIPNDLAQKFLNEAWLTIAGEKDLKLYKSHYERIFMERKIWRAIQEFRAENHELPEWLSVNSEPDFEIPPEILTAFSSRKQNYTLERARHLVVVSKRLFGQPFYDAVAAVVNAATGEALDPENLKRSMSDLRRKGK